MKQELTRKVLAFIDMYLPDEKPVLEGTIFTSHTLLYDFHGDYKHVQFTPAETQTCLDAYLDLIEPIIAYVESFEEDTWHHAYLYNFRWINASELLLAYLGRTVKDETLENLYQHLVTIQASNQIDKVLKVVDPDGDLRSLDAVKRVYTIHSILADWEARSSK